MFLHIPLELHPFNIQNHCHLQKNVEFLGLLALGFILMKQKEKLCFLENLVIFL